MRRWINTAMLVSGLFACTPGHRHEQPGTAISEHFFLQKAYPETEFPLEGYLKGMEISRRQVAARGSGPTGFNENWEAVSAGNFSGRINAIAVHPNDEQTVYAGLASGGIFKTTNGGSAWLPVFDNQAYLAIGALAIDPSNPETIYAGTGDPNVTGYPFIGDGLYRSSNGGKDWTYLGLRETRIISRIIIDPSDPRTIWVATMGLPFARTPDRGVYKSTDAGKTWRKVLFVAEQAGITDMVINPSNPKQLFAASWDRIRNNRESLINGPNAKVFRSNDGGETWKALSGGLPEQQNLGRIALAASENSPGRLFARYLGPDNELLNIFRSDNAGEQWTPIIDFSTSNLTAPGFFGGSGFGWYFGTLAVNPLDDKEIYVLGVDLWRTRDGGKNWELAAPSWRDFIVHADKHDLVFSRSGKKFLATDGGIYTQAVNNGSWVWGGTIPNLQFYRVGYNPHRPNWFYGGSQDIGTIGGPINQNWTRLYPFDGFAMLFHPSDSNLIYIQIQNGRKFVSRNGGQSWDNAANGFPASERTNWDCPFIRGAHQPHTLYSATFRVYRSSSGPVPQWAPISPDLTDGNRYGSLFHTISTLAESPLDSTLLYAGTTDGNVWRGSSTPGSWIPLTRGLPDRYVTAVRASPNFRDYVYTCFSGYKDNEFLPHLYRSKDRGETWENISAGLPPVGVNNLLVLRGYADRVLIAATDAGVYASINAGITWDRLGQNMPAVAIYDLAFNELKKTLIAGSYGRSMFSYPLEPLLSVPVSAAVLPTDPSVQFRIFPQPAHEKVQIQYENLPARAVELRIFDPLGRLVKAIPLEGNTAGQAEADLSSLAPGTYFTVLRWQGGAVGKGLIKAVPSG
ncbi:MAG: VPS10 domain-containing protein [Saprospiraceae bacterium]